MIELKPKFNAASVPPPWALNRTMIELKQRNAPRLPDPQHSLNRTMIELKLDYPAPLSS